MFRAIHRQTGRHRQRKVRLRLALPLVKEDEIVKRLFQHVSLVPFPTIDIISKTTAGRGKISNPKSAELGFDERFALVAELEGEEVVALVKRAEKEPVPFPQLLRQQFALRQPNEIAVRGKL